MEQIPAAPVTATAPAPTLGYATYASSPVLPLEKRRKAAAIAVIISTITSVAAQLATFAIVAVDFQGAAERGEPWVMPVALALIAAGLITIAALIVAAVLFLMWFYRAHVNATVMGARPRFSSGWAVGFWFIPIANWFMPYRAMQDVYNGSNPKPADANASTVGMWWVCWVIANILSTISGKLESHAEQSVTVVMDLISTALTIAACVLVLKLMRWITAAQDSNAVAGETSF